MIKFNYPHLFKTAMTHRSAINEKKGSQESNERLEFLGDAVLEIIVSDYLYRKFPNLPEGKLTEKRAQIVQTKTLAAAAINLGLDSQLILSKGELKAGGNHNPSLLANAFEALTGAIYLDQGIVAAKKFIQTYLLSQINTLLKTINVQDFKSSLQEILQKKYKTPPKYKLISSFGPDHHKTFIVQVFLNQKKLGEGSGFSKQAAQQQAAKTALEKIKDLC